jgi:hypothetical protein
MQAKVAMTSITLRIIVALLCYAGVCAEAEVTSLADWPCSEWQARRASGARVDAPQMWLSGFMTGLATARDMDVLSFTHAEALFAAMDKFCSAHPERNISAGGLAVFEQIRHSLPTDSPRAL